MLIKEKNGHGEVPEYEMRVWLIKVLACDEEVGVPLWPTAEQEERRQTSDCRTGTRLFSQRPTPSDKRKAKYARFDKRRSLHTYLPCLAQVFTPPPVLDRLHILSCYTKERWIFQFIFLKCKVYGTIVTSSRGDLSSKNKRWSKEETDQRSNQGANGKRWIWCRHHHLF